VSDIILHHYPQSLYSEKVRLILGLKNLAWKSVIIPMVAPKPDLTPLTGGYRRTPVLQIGADVYCDTALIAEVLERVAPEKSLYPHGQQGIVQTIAQWGDSNLFWAAIAYFYQTDGVALALSQLPPEQVQAYHQDRAELLRTRPLSSFPETKATLSLYLQRLQQMLEGGQPFLLGDAVSLADISCYHPLWVLRMVPPIAAVLEQDPVVLPWMDRLKSVGHGRPSELAATDALAIARNSPPTVTRSAASDIPGIALGDEVEVMPSDYGLDPVRGELVLVEANHVAVRRHDERAGTVVVHFPRIGYLIRQVGTAAG
jgi:glutathione S-transferase